MAVLAFLLTTQARAVDVELGVPVLPTPFRADGHVYLAYELIITNRDQEAIEIDRIDVVPGDGHDDAATPLVSYTSAQLAQVLVAYERLGPANGSATRIAPGQRSAAYVWIALENDLDLPESLAHRVQCAASGATSTQRTIGAVISPRAFDETTIGPPLRGGPWLAFNGPGNDSGHRRTFIKIDKPHIAQRFAIDWGKIDATGSTFAGNPLENQSYHCYGAEVLAVADGMVAAIKDGIPENIPGENSRAIKITLDTAAGNHVMLDLGGGRFALYAHLQPGSLRVAAGAHVKRGQVLALLGNSGNSTEPHLHFHVTDGTSPLGSEGLPYHFATFEVLGRLGASRLAQPQRHQAELPLQDWIVQFADD